jgi:CRISPR-associated endoribonuclease Cas6
MSRLYSILLKLRSESEAIISPTQGYHIYALFLDLVKKSDPELAESLHRSEAPKPFTISPLQGKFQRSGKQVKLTLGSIYWVRLTFLKDELLAYFMDSTLKTVNEPIYLDSASFHLQEVEVIPHASSLCLNQSYTDLLESALPKRQITLEFPSPTAFRSSGKRNMLYPDPCLVFGSYLRKWQEFAPHKMNEALSRYFSSILLVRYRLHTRILDFSSYQEVGFEGKCTFELGDSMPEEAVLSTNALADFAFYSGTGAKTTMGMGQTRRIARGTRKRL